MNSASTPNASPENPSPQPAGPQRPLDALPVFSFVRLVLRSHVEGEAGDDEAHARCGREHEPEHHQLGNVRGETRHRAGDEGIPADAAADPLNALDHRVAAAEHDRQTAEPKRAAPEPHRKGVVPEHLLGQRRTSDEDPSTNEHPTSADRHDVAVERKNLNG